jgi:hypothetical protein
MTTTFFSQVGWFNVRSIADVQASGYTTGGLTIAGGAGKTALGLLVGGGNTGYFDSTTGKLMLYSASGTELAAGSGYSYTLTVIGQ